MPVRAVLASVLLLAVACSARAAPHRVPFGPPDSEVEFRAYGIGLVPIDANFTRFSGWLSYDPDDKASCRVELRIQATSLVAGDSSLRDTIAGPDFLDVGNFPTLEYAGSCREGGLGGTLAMHGVRREFGLSLDWTADRVVAEGRLVRADWGMTARPLLGGRTVRIRVAVPLSNGEKQISHPAKAP